MVAGSTPQEQLGKAAAKLCAETREGKGSALTRAAPHRAKQKQKPPKIRKWDPRQRKENDEREKKSDNKEEKA